MQERNNHFEPFLFSFSPTIQLRVQNEEEIVPAIMQIEYLAHTDTKLKKMCTDECLKDLGSDDLSPIEQTCLAQCTRKLSVFYNSFYA